ncbi:MAG: STAS-like domain-containing protein [Candidatus Omnitrophota bacterium]
MININIFNRVGAFAENKDIAREIRIKEILPALTQGKEVTLDFNEVDAATQSFIHALISDILRKHGADVLDHIAFKSCNITVKKIIEIVVDYMLEGMGIEEEENRE